MAELRLALDKVTALVADPDEYSVGIITQILRGFGLQHQYQVESKEEALSVLGRHQIDLCIVEAKLADGDASDMIRAIRRLDTAKRFVPVIMLTGFTTISQVKKARDCGANIIVKKPISANVLFTHIAWAASDPRSFVEAKQYVGPDRRFKFEGIPDGQGRRSTDLSEDAGMATEPNLSQEEIEAMWKPTKVAL